MNRFWSQVRPPWLARDVALLMGTRALMSTMQALAGVILPIYLVRIGFGAFRLGVLFAVVTLAGALMSSAVGLLSDQLGRKFFILFIPSLAAVAAVGFVLTRDVPLLFVMAALGSFGRGGGAGGGGNVGPYQPAEQAYVADATPAVHRNSVFGRLAFSSALGAAVGGQLARAPQLARRFGLRGLASFHVAFLLMAVLAAAAVFVALPIADGRPASRAGADAPRTVRFPRRSRPLLYRLWTANAVNGLAIGLFGPFMTFWFYTRFGASAATIGLVYSVINVTSMFSNLSAASFARRFGLIRAVFIGRIVQATLLTAMAVAPTFWIAAGIYLVRMLAARAAMPLRQSYQMALADPEERASVAGLAGVPSRGTQVVSQLGAGYIFEHISLELPFVIGSVLQLINGVLYYGFFRHMPPPEEVTGGGTADAPDAPVER